MKAHVSSTVDRQIPGRVYNKSYPDEQQHFALALCDFNDFPLISGHFCLPVFLSVLSHIMLRRKIIVVYWQQEKGANRDQRYVLRSAAVIENKEAD